MKRRTVTSPKAPLRTPDERIDDLDLMLDDFHPAVRGGWVWVERPNLNGDPVKFTGQITDIVRETSGRFPGRELLYLRRPDRPDGEGFWCPVLPEHAVSRKPPQSAELKEFKRLEKRAADKAAQEAA